VKTYNNCALIIASACGFIAVIMAIISSRHLIGNAHSNDNIIITDMIKLTPSKLNQEIAIDIPFKCKCECIKIEKFIASCVCAKIEIDNPIIRRDELGQFHIGLTMKKIGLWRTWITVLYSIPGKGGVYAHEVVIDANVVQE
jgi:hypothetical protein